MILVGQMHISIVFSFKKTLGKQSQMQQLPNERSVIIQNEIVQMDISNLSLVSTWMANMRKEYNT